LIAVVHHTSVWESWLVGATPLALLDSTSFGTLLIPLWLMTSRHVPLRHHLLYLAAVAGSRGARAGAPIRARIGVQVEGLLAALDTTAGRVGQLVLGVALLVFALLPQRWRPAGRHGGGALARPGPARRHLGTSASDARPRRRRVRSTDDAALLRRRGPLTTADVSGAATAGLLLRYGLLIILPTLLLLAVRRLAARRVEPTLVRLERLASRHGTEATLWAVGLVSFPLARHAAFRLGLLGSA
jgi:hypothetical protein